MESISHSRTRMDIRSKADLFARKLFRKQKERSQLSSPLNSDPVVGEMGREVTACEYESLVLFDNSSILSSPGTNISDKKQSFEL